MVNKVTLLALEGETHVQATQASALNKELIIKIIIPYVHTRMYVHRVFQPSWNKS